LINEEEKYLHLANKFIDNARSTEKIVEKIIQLLTETNGFSQHLDKTLTDQTSATFLGSLVFTLNSAIRHDFLNFKSDRRCFRKAFLSTREITEYYSIFKSESKRFCWQSFATVYLDTNYHSNNNNINKKNGDIYNKEQNELSVNVIFVIDFRTDAFGVNIESYSCSGIPGEILLPAMSLFEISNIATRQSEHTQGMELLHISLVKLDQNPNSRAKHSQVNKEKDLSKCMKVMRNELSLLKVAEEANRNKYTYLQDQLDSFLIKFALSGPPHSPYESGLFQVNMEIPKTYPNEAPKVRFKTKIWHPNVNFDSGLLKHPELGSKWKPSCSIANLIEIIMQILAHPEIYDPDSINPAACNEYFRDRKVFEAKAKEYTYEYAKNQEGIKEILISSKNVADVEYRRLLLKNDLLSSVNFQNFNRDNLVSAKKDNNYNELNFNYNNNQKDNHYNLFNKAFDKANYHVESVNENNCESKRNEALEKEEFHKSKEADISRKSNGNHTNLTNNHFFNLNYYDNDNFIKKNYNDFKNSYNNYNDNRNWNEKCFDMYNGKRYNQPYLPENEFEEALNFDMKADNDINIINSNLRKRKNTELSGNGIQEKKNHSNYDVDFDSKKDINLSENYE